MPQITIGKGLAFYEEAQALPGVKRVAGMVKQDIELVTGVSPAGITSGQGSGCAVLYGTIGHSPMLDALEAAGKLDLNAIRGKWECYALPWQVLAITFTNKAAGHRAGDCGERQARHHLRAVPSFGADRRFPAGQLEPCPAAAPGHCGIG